MTRDYKRNDTATLFTALRPQHAALPESGVHSVLNAIEAELAADNAVRVIFDSYNTHKQPKVRAWLVRHPRSTFHFVPTSCLWQNAAEGFFAKLIRRRLKNGVFHSFVDLHAAINRFVNQHNKHNKPFIWRADTGEIIAAVGPRHQSWNQSTSETPVGLAKSAIDLVHQRLGQVGQYSAIVGPYKHLYRHASH